VKHAAAALATLTNQALPLQQPLLEALSKQQQQQAKTLQAVQLPPLEPAAVVALQPQQHQRGSSSNEWCCLGAAWT
jgi:hypothetical protein